MLGHDAKGAEVDGWQKLNQLRAAMPNRVDDLSQPEREKLFATFFPRLADAMEATWQLCHHLPYTEGYARKSFRAPRRPEATRERRSS